MKQLYEALLFISLLYNSVEKKLSTDPSKITNIPSTHISVKEEISQAIQDAILINGVVAIGISLSIGTGGYLCGSAQLVIDMEGNIGLQFSGGSGVQAGASADGTAYVAVYPNMENIYNLEGFGTDIGVSLGEGFIGSAGFLSTGEGDDLNLAGGYIGVGIGGEVTLLEGHASISDTFPTISLGNIYTDSIDTLTTTWDIAYKVWKYILAH